MGSHWNTKNIGNVLPIEGSCEKPPGNSSLVRQSSVYSMTFDEFQSTWGGGLGKDFGSINMDELLKNIWSAEESQAMTSSVGSGAGYVSGGNLQRQGSLTLPRTLSQKTVDEVWRGLMKESTGSAKDGSGGAVPNIPQRQQTLGEMTLEEFLVRAGVVREDMQQTERPNNSGFFSELLSPNSNLNDTGLLLGFQQPNRNNVLVGTQKVMDNSNLIVSQPPGLALNVGGIRSPHNFSQQLLQKQGQQLQQQQQPLFPKPTTAGFSSSMHLVNNSQLVSPVVGGSVIGIANPPVNDTFVHGGGMAMAGVGTGGVTVAAVSPANKISPDMIANSNADTPSPSPVPCVFSRGRKANVALEKVIERRHRRMIKNRESAARSRARKQAYTLELEAEVAKLKELNEELQKKQAEILELQKNRSLETMNWQYGCKRQCLRRTLTGPW